MTRFGASLMGKLPLPTIDGQALVVARLLLVAASRALDEVVERNTCPSLLDDQGEHLCLVKSDSAHEDFLREGECLEITLLLHLLALQLLARVNTRKFKQELQASSVVLCNNVLKETVDSQPRHIGNAIDLEGHDAL